MAKCVTYSVTHPNMFKLLHFEKFKKKKKNNMLQPRNKIKII